MRQCRICKSVDVLDNMINFFEDNFHIILDINYLANISIVEIEGKDAKICRKCVKSLKQAVEFKKLCIESENSFKKNSNETYEWHERLLILKSRMNETVNNEPKSLPSSSLDPKVHVQENEEVKVNEYIRPEKEATKSSHIQHEETISSKDNETRQNNDFNEDELFEQFAIEADEILTQSIREIEDLRVQQSTSKMTDFTSSNSIDKSVDESQYDFINLLTYDQLKDLTLDVSCLLTDSTQNNKEAKNNFINNVSENKGTKNNTDLLQEENKRKLRERPSREVDSFSFIGVTKNKVILRKHYLNK